MTSIRLRIIRIAILTGFLLVGCARSPHLTAPSASGTVENGPLASAFLAGAGGDVSRAAPLQGHEFVPRSDNPFFPLVPGTKFHYRAQTADGVETEDVTVTGETERIQGASTIVVKDVVRLDGKVIERTTDWYAMDELGNVWYFGEDTRSIDPETGEVSTEGSWQAGRDGAQAGIIMEAHPQVGDMYNEEDAPGVAQDQAKVVALDATATVPADEFTGCLETANTTPLEPGATEHKFYAPGVGLVLEIDTDGSRNELVRVTRSRDHGERSSDDDGDESSDGPRGDRDRGRDTAH